MLVILIIFNHIHKYRYISIFLGGFIPEGNRWIPMAVIPVKIRRMRQETPTIKILELDLMGREFSYYPGQWIDCYADIEGERQVAGYSIASSPTTEGVIEVAIKSSDNPVTRYIHDRARAGDTLYVEGGQGEVYYTREMGDSLVILAAGIGISPMMGILRYTHAVGDVDAEIVYGAASDEELAYLDKIISITNANPRITLHITVSGGDTRHREGRIDEAFLRDLELDTDALYFICGPPPMIESTADTLRKMGVQNSRIRYELWW
jgi:ferredoxin-NADP reductase